MAVVSDVLVVWIQSLTLHAWSIETCCTDIERTYGERKPLAARMPLQTASVPNNATSLASSIDDDPNSTPGLTDASADSDTEIETSDREIGPESRNAYQQHRKRVSSIPIENETSQVPITRHDLDNKYFHHDLLVFKNFDLFRSVSSSSRYLSVSHYAERSLSLSNRDLAFAVLAFYAILVTVLPPTTRHAQITLAFVNALLWRIFHTFGLGLALKYQSEQKWIVRHFLKHYHYEADGEPVQDAFSNWKATYNLSLCMSYGKFEKRASIPFSCRDQFGLRAAASFCALAWKCYSIPEDWTVGSQLVRHTLGLVSCLLVCGERGSPDHKENNHSYWLRCTSGPLGRPTRFSVLSAGSMVSLDLSCWFRLDADAGSGTFVGDFFIQDYPHELYYTGIFRFLNNPERSMGGAAYMGLVLICGSKTLLIQAVIAVLAHWWFLSVVEK